MLESLPTLQYNIDGITYDAVNVFKRLNVDVPATEILKTTVNYGERPDQISQRLYGTPDYYWSIILANKDNPFINPIERLGETTRTTAELEAGQDLDPRDYFVQFSRSVFDLYQDGISASDFASLGLTGNTTISDHRIVEDIFKIIKPGDIIAFEPQNEDIFCFGAGQQKLGLTTSNSYYPQYGQSIVPNSIITDNLKILDVAAGDKWSAALDTTGYIHIWGGITGSTNYTKIEDGYFKSSTDGFTALSAAEDLLLAINASDGGITCFGNCSRFNSLYSGQTKFKKIAWSKGTTGFGIGISGSHNYTNVVGDGANITYTLSGKAEVYTFGGITHGLGITHIIDFKTSGATWAIDVGCTDTSCFVSFNDLPEFYSTESITDETTNNTISQSFYSNNFGLFKTHLSPANKTVLEYNTTGNWQTLSKNNMQYKLYDELFKRVLQHARNKGAHFYNSSTDRYYYDFTGTTFETNTFTTTANLLDHTTPSYTRNSNNWLQSIGEVDISCIPVWQSVSDTYAGSTRPQWTRCGLLITPQHLITPDHFPLQAGSSIRFVSMDNTIVQRNIIDSILVAPGTDARIVLLDSPVPTVGAGKIKIPKLFDANWNAPYFNSGPYGTQYFAVKSNQYRQLSIIRTFAPTAGPDGYFSSVGDESYPNNLGSRILGGKSTINLDSGSPVFFVIDGELVGLGGIATSGSYKSFTHNTALPVDKTDRAAGASYIQGLCDTLSARNSKAAQTINFYRINSGEYLEENTKIYNPHNKHQIKTNKNNVFLSIIYKKIYNLGYSLYTDPETLTTVDYYVPGPQYYKLYDCYGTDSDYFEPYSNIVDLGTSTVINYSITNKSVAYVYIKDYKSIICEIKGKIKIWKTEIYGSVFNDGINSVYPLMNAENGTPFDPNLSNSSKNRVLDSIGDNLFVNGGAEHYIIGNTNKTKIGPSNYLQVISTDSPYKRIFVKDLNGNMVSFLNADTSFTRFSIIRKNSSGYYDILKINNNSLRGIITSKALRIIGKYWDLSNLNPSNKNQWNDYLNMLDIYFNGDIEAAGDLINIKKLPFKNPVEIQYYSKSYVAQLRSDLPTLLNS